MQASTAVNILLCGFLLIAGCAHSPTTQTPKILASTHFHGKGVPYGRSDSQEQYDYLQQISSDSTYGYTSSNPIKVGDVMHHELGVGSQRERLFLNALLGPNGEPIEYERIGSCCSFQTPNGIQGGGFLDVFRITIGDSPVLITLYLNMYDPGEPTAPAGFTFRSKPSIIGKWSWTREANNCTETYVFKPDGTTSVTSGEERTESVYQISDAPDADGFFKFTDKISKDYGGKDCADDTSDLTGDEATNFIIFHPSGKLMLICASKDPKSCFGPLK